MRRALITVAVLLSGWAAYGDPPELQTPWPEMVAKCLRTHACAMDCTAERCAAVEGVYLGFDHTAYTLWVGGRRATTAQSAELGADGAWGVHWMDRDRVEVVGIPPGVDQYPGFEDYQPIRRVFRVGPEGLVEENPPKRPTQAPPVERADCEIDFETTKTRRNCVTEDGLDERIATALRAICPGSKADQPVRGECTRSGCALALGSNRDVTCAAWLPARGRPALLPAFDWVSIRGQRLCIAKDGGCPIGCADQSCFRMGEPLRLDIPTTPLRVNEVLDVPPTRSGLWSRPLVCDTAVHVRYGQDAWGGPQDASVSWLVRHGPKSLQLIAEVSDDVLIPASAARRAVASDHLEIEMSLSKYAVLLGENGKVEGRRWRSVNQDVDEPAAITGRWSKRAGGYRIEFQLPLPIVTRGEIGGVQLRFSDSDDGVHQKVLIGTPLRMRLWREFPPSLSEVRARE